MSIAEQLQTLAEHIRLSGTLGRSLLMRRLFDFLVECSLAGRTPKEAEVAIEVFGKDPGFDVNQDATVRVYIHKLRHRIDEYYAGPGRTEAFRLSIPKGAYRFVITSHADEVDAPLPQSPQSPEPPPSPRSSQSAQSSPPWRPRWRTGLFAASLAFNAALLLATCLLVLRHPPARGIAPVAAAAVNPVWARILQDERPIVLVFGDYYIFGETGPDMQLKRLVREFSINSSADLDQYLEQHPELADRYLDMQLKYLPISAAYALRDLMPVLAGADRRIRVTLASELDLATLKSADIIYMGYLSGMGMLGDLTFMGSRFKVGETFDELIDRTTGTHYISQAAVPEPGDGKYHDYGYFATFAGPAGNQIVVIAGTRDVAVMRTAENVTHPAELAKLTAANTGRSFEALYDVFAMNGTDLASRVLVASAIDPAKIWGEERPAQDQGILKSRRFSRSTAASSRPPTAW